ncbi:MAG TPA: hypothetical protein VMC08_03830 [Bacteroidales bacterium]|nr:hypothetical protein [Bacteroidales bacterium]
MNSRKLVLPVWMIVMTVFLFACSITSPNAKLLVGSWKPVSAEKYVDPAKAKPVVKQQAVPDSASLAKGKKTNPGMSEADHHAEMELERAINTEKRTPMIVKADKTAEKAYHQQTVKGSWKLKKQGKQIIFTEANSGKKLKADILQINDTTVVLVERLPVGDIKVKYVKQH